jgi:hypothetical protein
MHLVLQEFQLRPPPLRDDPGAKRWKDEINAGAWKASPIEISPISKSNVSQEFS